MMVFLDVAATVVALGLVSIVWVSCLRREWAARQQRRAMAAEKRQQAANKQLVEQAVNEMISQTEAYLRIKWEQQHQTGE